MALILSACTKGEKKPPTLSERGRSVYNTHCTSCHGANPKIDGVLGPAVFGSSLELLELRVLKAQYPPGYTPKRETKQMAMLPFLKDEIPALHAYLNQP
jgi:mono/diheme cytochrome c family protein